MFKEPKKWPPHGGWLEITCDKCGYSEATKDPSREQASKMLYDSGWRMNPRARKYVHLCGNCGRR